MLISGNVLKSLGTKYLFVLSLSLRQSVQFLVVRTASEISGQPAGEETSDPATEASQKESLETAISKIVPTIRDRGNIHQNGIIFESFFSPLLKCSNHLTQKDWWYL